MIQRRTYLKRKTPLRRCSKKRMAENRIYAVQRVEFLENHPCCEVGRKDICTGRATQVHHVKKRGKHYTDASTFMAVCPSCHQWITDHQGQARVLGFLA